MYIYIYRERERASEREVCNPIIELYSLVYGE